MKSSFVFKKKEKLSEDNEGSGVYFGCPDLDRVFGFQLNQGSTILMEEESNSAHTLCLARYFIGYGLIKDEAVSVIDLDVEEWKHLFPKPMEKKKAERINGNKKDSQKNNKIAWRYSATSAGYTKCELRPDYVILDLSKNENLGENQGKKVTFNELLEAQSLRDVYEIVESVAQSVVESPEDTTTKRILLTGIDHLLMKASRADVLKLAKGISILAHTTRSVFLVRMDASLLKENGLKKQFESFFDIVMDCDLIHSKIE